MNVIEARGLTKAYRGKRVVDRLDMRVAQGATSTGSSGRTGRASPPS